MRCNQALSRIEQLAKQGLAYNTDHELTEHINSCAGCKNKSIVIFHLENMLEAGRENKTEPLPSFEQMQKRVLTQSHKQPAIKTRLRPVLVSVAVSVVLLLFVTLIPFENARTIGYNLHLEGVNQTLAEDDEMFCNLLFQLELWEAEVDFLGCDSICRVMVLDLKTEQEVNLVMAAVQKIDEHNITADIIPIKVNNSGTLIDY